MSVRPFRRFSANPQQPIAQRVEPHWHKFAAILMQHFGVTEFEITHEQIERLTTTLGEKGAIAVDARHGKLILRIVPEEEALRIVEQEGGQ